MIKNEKQFKISAKRLTELDQQIASLQENLELDSLKKELMLAPLLLLKKDIEGQIQTYVSIRTRKSILTQQRSFSELPSLIIEYKIASGLTQKRLSEKIGLKEQQWQRYEAEEFASISFRNLIALLNRMGIDLVIKPSDKSSKNKSGKSIR
jgi:HTH-type transcriptional regulator/antitoxin HipB